MYCSLQPYVLQVVAIMFPDYKDIHSAIHVWQHGQSAAALLGVAPAGRLHLLRPRLVALCSSALPGAEVRPLGAPPPPQLLKRAASKGRSPMSPPLCLTLI